MGLGLCVVCSELVRPFATRLPLHRTLFPPSPSSLTNADNNNKHTIQQKVCTACANAFAHGSNEVANAVGPLAAIYQVWQESAVKPSSPVPTWLLAIGAFGICFGLATCECLLGLGCCGFGVGVVVGRRWSREHRTRTSHHTHPKHTHKTQHNTKHNNTTTQQTSPQTAT